MKKHTITRLLVLLLVLAIAVPYLPVVVSANDGAEIESFATQLADYDNRTEFVINNKEDLKAFMNSGKNFVNKTVKLGADIVWNDGTVDYTNGTFTMKDGSDPEVWTPFSSNFGDNSGAVIFDGQGHKISGLYIKTEATSYSGFFTRITKATIKNVIFDNGYFENSATTAKQIGFVAGVAYGANTFKNVHVIAYQTHASTATNPSIGGMCGYLYSAAETKFESCTVSGVVSALAATTVGGFVGFAQYFATILTMTDCVNYASVEGKNYVAGLAGRLKGDATFTRCTSVGTITAENSLVASLATMYNDNTSSIPTVTFTDCIHATKSTKYAAMLYYSSSKSYSNFKVKVDNNDLVDYTNNTSGLTAMATELTGKFNSFTKGSTGAINVYGVQQSLDKTSARFIATLKTNTNQNENTIKAVGFEIAALGRAGVSKDCPCVYESVKATQASGEIRDIKVGEGEFANVNYLATCIIPNVPTNADGVATLVVSAYIITKNGTRVESTKGALILTISGGNVVGIAHTI